MTVKGNVTSAAAEKVVVTGEYRVETGDKVVIK